MIINKYQGNGGGGSATSAETAEFAFIAGESEILGGHTDAPSASDFDAASLNITAAEWSDSEPNTTRGAKKGGTRSVAGEKFFKVPSDIEALITSGVVANGQPYLVADFGYGDNASGVPNTLHIWWNFFEEGQPIEFMFAANYYCEDWDWRWIDSVDLYDENNPYEIPICGSDGLKWCLAWYSAGTYLKIWVQDSEGYVFTDAINTHNVGLWGLCIKKEDRWESVIPQMKTINGESIIGEGNITLATTGGAQGPMGMQGPQGLQGDKGDLGYQGPQGPQGQDGIDQDPTLLKSVSELPATADTGDVVALSVEGSGLPNGITFVEREYDGGLQGRRLTVPFGSLDDLGEGELLFIGKVGPEGSLDDLNLSFAGLANNYVLTYEDPYDPMLSVYLEPNTTSTDAINGVIFAVDFTDSAFTVDMYPDTTEVNEIEFSDIPEGTSQVGVYQYDGTNWNAIGGGAGGGVVYLDTLSGVTGEENTIYECDSHLWTWNNSGGTCAEWSDSITQYIDSPRGFGLIFSHIPDGQTILGFRYRYNNKAWRYIKMSGNTLVLTEEDGTTIVNSCTYGQDKKFEGSYAGGSYYVNVRYQKHYLGVEIKDSIETKDVWSGTAAGGHFEIVDHTNYPYISESNNGVPYWNSKGEVIGKRLSAENKMIIANTTGSSNATNFLVQSSGSFPSRMFVPTQSGVAGQVLLSAGNGEPQWSNWIKCVKITSDAYEALQDKDPNTLYLIDDE